ncbi:MAG TPA: ATP-dependent DNA helicase [bacterium]|nr:ATP-dependent DNA helicase [bacterium]HOR57070.1 ATP-dependent DNA helicase [bacterium]HPL55957.1 ATP-dependent DNA helicase [bacterium]
MKDLIAGLNEKQKKAVTHNYGPLLVLAGAGTGKTTVVTRRIAWLITHKKVPPSSILALTFTDKAGAEMETRVDKLVPYGYTDTWISTFHAFADRILRQYAIESNLTSNYKVLSQSEQAIFLREHIYDFDIDILRPASNPTKNIPAIVEHINHLKDELITPLQYLHFAQTKIEQAKEGSEAKEARRYLELAKIYSGYQELLEMSDLVDFGEQILKTVKLLEENNNILRTLQEKFQYCLVDEFQDTNPAQNRIIELLFGAKALHQNITVVGDDDQSIYQFRGAAVRNILNFQKVWPKAKIIVLSRNYRSGQILLDRAYNLIKFNNPERLEVKAKINKRLKAVTLGEQPKFNLFEEDFSESQAIADEIIKLNKEGASYNDIAILTRANSQSNSIIYALRAQGIPYIAPGSSGLYDEPIIRLIISFIQSISDHNDYLSYFYLATSEIYRIKTETLTAIVSYAKNNNLPFRRVLNRVSAKDHALEQLIGDEKEKIERFTSDVNKYSDFSRTHNVGEVVYKWLNETGILKKLIKKAETDLLAQVELENIAEFYEKIKDFLRSSSYGDTRHFADNLRLFIEAGENPSLSQEYNDINAVTVLTVHSAKGLEWPIVFLPSLADDRFPTRHRQRALPLPEELVSTVAGKDDHIREERRLFYVAMTRCKEKLIMSVAKRYDRGVREKKITRFVYEALGEEIIPNKKQPTPGAVEKISIFSDHKTQGQTREKRKVKFKGYLTPHQIDDYLTCPKKFEFIHIIKMPILANWQVQYGVAIHQAVELYYKKKLEKKTPLLEEILTTYNNTWRSEGYVSFEHEQAKKKIGEKSLYAFFEREEKLKRNIIAVELPFEFQLGAVKIRGRYDAVFQEKEKKVIMDFKTSDVDEEKKAKERVKESTQMQIYTLSEETNTGLRPEVGLYFVESGLVAYHDFSDKEMEKTKKIMEATQEGIEKNNFKATPGYNECRWCAYKTICPYKTKGA